MVTHEIVRLPSASVLGLLRKARFQRQAPPKAVVVFADPVFDRNDPRLTEANRGSARITDRGTPVSRGEHLADEVQSGEPLERSAGFYPPSRRLQFPRLPLTREEAKTIVGLIPDDTGRVVLDFDANRAGALGSALTDYRIVHFATHAVAINDHPELSGLVLSLLNRRGRAVNGFLGIEDVYNLRLNADLVVLSACDTALGDEIKGEGLVALSRGFMHAGAPRVVATLWRVEDAAMTELMRRFYTGMLRNRLTPAAALRDAQLTMLRSRRWRSPYFWAGLELQGDWKSSPRRFTTLESTYALHARL